MAKALVRARKVGGSIVVRIPKEVADAEDIKVGQLIEIEVEKARRDWFGALKGVGGFAKSDEMDAHD